MNRLALPFTLLRYSLPKSRSQAIYISNIVSIDRPGFCFFRRIRRFTIDRYAYTLSVGEKFFFDTRHLLPTYCNNRVFSLQHILQSYSLIRMSSVSGVSGVSGVSDVSAKFESKWLTVSVFHLFHLFHLCQQGEEITFDGVWLPQ